MAHSRTRRKTLTVAQVARGLMGTYLDWFAHLFAASDAGVATPRSVRPVNFMPYM
ncbi:hypothetical protein Rrhod_3953 [Rhodococcus rhodnii LMG 5362]|uniref:Uncharacterized protein n=2 Tax=Rhodococcus rhodnii TaxID=38312 RepID=R7WHR0_9NOCA|nr:hypothetical protein Rrhod_3953 [Rhodococcus rhodnii LMG 5362]